MIATIGLPAVTTLFTASLARVRRQTTMAPSLITRRVDESELTVPREFVSMGGEVPDGRVRAGLPQMPGTRAARLSTWADREREESE
jgi:hypothetical protein